MTILGVFHNDKETNQARINQDTACTSGKNFENMSGSRREQRFVGRRIRKKNHEAGAMHSGRTASRVLQITL
jgi:hypothetical protein